jgi:N-methylhydantoinase B
MTAKINHTDPVRLEVFKHLFAAIAEEMGMVLRKASYSPNIKERRDFSCAVFDDQGNMIAQAAHIPVHLGSMPLSVQTAIESFNQGGSPREAEATRSIAPGDLIILNDPFQGGTHLPDITLVSPVFIESNVVDTSQASQDAAPVLLGFVASRAHHADIGGITPGSMPVATEIYQEGLIIPPVKLIASGKLNEGVWDLILANVRTPEERAGDLLAQIAANQRGEIRLRDLVARYGQVQVRQYMAALLVYTERITRSLLRSLPEGSWSFTDYLDDDGLSSDPVPICVKITISGDHAVIDFTGSSPQRPGGVNAVYAITLSAVHYVFRCLLGLDVPNNSGCLAPIEVIAPTGSIVNATPPSPVVGGNVETSQRIVDVLLGALASACPERIPAASQGTMNNVIIGGWDRYRQAAFTYYETIAGGVGARPFADGPPGEHTHMTNTLNTPVEALEFSYPLRVMRYEIRRGSGGVGRFSGGNGLIREIQFLCEAQVTLLTERRKLSPYGLAGGSPGLPGRNTLIRDDRVQDLGGKVSFTAKESDILLIETPGGGGHGE